MKTRKRIPKIELPPYPGDTTATLIGDQILFITIQYDQDSDDPCSWDGFGKILVSQSRRRGGDISSGEALGTLWSDEDAVPLSYSSAGGSCAWAPYAECEEILSDIHVERVTIRLRGEDPTYGPDDDFEPEWLERIGGIWVPDQCVRDSYTGQDGLSRREWMVGQAKSACDTYTQWGNGEVYGYEIETFALLRDEDGEPLTDPREYEAEATIIEDSCWGFYGWDVVSGEALAIVKSALTQMKFSRRAISAAMKEAA